MSSLESNERRSRPEETKEMEDVRIIREGVSGRHWRLEVRLSLRQMSSR